MIFEYLNTTDILKSVSRFNLILDFKFINHKKMNSTYKM
jgi:hypothetical protein